MSLYTQNCQILSSGHKGKNGKFKENYEEVWREKNVSNSVCFWYDTHLCMWWRTYSVKSSCCPIANLLIAKRINGRPCEANLSASAVVAILLIIFTSFLIDRRLSLRFILKKSQPTRDIRCLFLFVRYNSHDSVMGMAETINFLDCTWRPS